MAMERMVHQVWDHELLQKGESSKRDDAAVDWLLGVFMDEHVGGTDDCKDYCFEVAHILAATRAQAHLPNRRKLLEMTEAAMDKDASEKMRGE